MKYLGDQYSPIGVSPHFLVEYRIPAGDLRSLRVAGKGETQTR